MSDKAMRLSKYMSEQGICSRREADKYIEMGWVKVNSEIAQLGQKIIPPVQVELALEAHECKSQKLTIALYKPIGYVSGPKEGEYPSALDLILDKNQSPEFKKQRLDYKLKTGLAPAGRLDVDSTGLLILTSDGVVAKQIIGPQSRLEKEYHIKIDGSLSEQNLNDIRQGLTLDGKKLLPCQVSWIVKEHSLSVILVEGKKRQVRRIFEAKGVRVTALRRVRVGKLLLNGLKPGQWKWVKSSDIF